MRDRLDVHGRVRKIENTIKHNSSRFRGSTRLMAKKDEILRTIIWHGDRKY